MSRRALLLGLDNYQDTGPQDIGLKLDAPRNDVALLAQTLIFLGFRSEDIVSCISSKGPSLTTSNLRRQIRGFVRDEAKADDDLLVYVSAHGVDQDGQRLILPVDYYRDDPQPPSALLGDHWLFGIARESPGKSVLLILDACREGVKFDLAPDLVSKGKPSTAPSSAAENSPTVAIVYSCCPTKQSWATDGSEALSYFTKSLTQVLQTDEHVATLGQVIEAVNARLKELLPPEKEQACYLDERRITGRQGRPEQLIIKEDQAQRLLQRISLSNWCRTLEAAPYWKPVAASSPGLGLQLMTIAVRAEEMVQRARVSLPQDRWRTNSALKRYLDGLDLVVPATRRDAATAALALAVPFVYEAILAGLVIQLAETGPVLRPSPDDISPGTPALAARAWGEALRLEEDWARRRIHLTQSGKSRIADDLLVWQLLAFAHNSGELWAYSEGHPAGATGWLNDFLTDLFSPAPFVEVAGDPKISATLSGRRLVRLARLLFTGPEDVENEASKSVAALKRGESIGRGSDLWLLDEVEVAHISALAAGVALDARRMPPLIAEHLGLDQEFTLDLVQLELDRSIWQKIDRRLELVLDTAYPAIHAALTDAVSRVELHRRWLEHKGTLGSRVLELLPTAILSGRLAPKMDAWDRPMFERQHLRFTLDQARVMQLLMGEALYGDPKLALRELYQNALDACRYRRAREMWLATRPEHGGDAHSARNHPGGRNHRGPPIPRLRRQRHRDG